MDKSCKYFFPSILVIIPVIIISQTLNALLVHTPKNIIFKAFELIKEILHLYPATVNKIITQHTVRRSWMCSSLSLLYIPLSLLNFSSAGPFWSATDKHSYCRKINVPPYTEYSDIIENKFSQIIFPHEIQVRGNLKHCAVSWMGCYPTVGYLPHPFRHHDVQFISTGLYSWMQRVAVRVT